MHKYVEKRKIRRPSKCSTLTTSSMVKALPLIHYIYKMSTFETPLKLGPLLLKNCVIMASLTRNRNLVPGPLQVKYYTERAGAGQFLQ